MDNSGTRIKKIQNMILCGRVKFLMYEKIALMRNDSGIRLTN